MMPDSPRRPKNVDQAIESRLRSEANAFRPAVSDELRGRVRRALAAADAEQAGVSARQVPWLRLISGGLALAAAVAVAVLLLRRPTLMPLTPENPTVANPTTMPAWTGRMASFPDAATMIGGAVSSPYEAEVRNLADDARRGTRAVLSVIPNLSIASSESRRQ